MQTKNAMLKPAARRLPINFERPAGDKWVIAIPGNRWRLINDSIGSNGGMLYYGLVVYRKKRW